jgi:hypothetical protein
MKDATESARCPRTVNTYISSSAVACGRFSWEAPTELYIYSHIRLRDVMVNWLSTGTILAFKLTLTHVEMFLMVSFLLASPPKTYRHSSFFFFFNILATCCMWDGFH